MTTSKSLIFRFADIEVREREFCLVKAGEVVAVEPKAFQVLLYLLRKPQKLVSKEELLNAVWSNTSVTENSLPRNIAKLRRLLKDDSREPRYIATVATVGYRLVCEVEVCEDIQGSLAGPSPLHPSGLESTGALTTENGFAAAANSPSELATEQGKQRFRGRWQLSAMGLLTAGLASAVGTCIARRRCVSPSTPSSPMTAALSFSPEPME